MSVPRPGEVTPQRVRAFAGEIGGIGFVVGILVERLQMGAWRSELEFYVICAALIALLQFGAYRLRQWPPTRF